MKRIYLFLISGIIFTLCLAAACEAKSGDKKKALEARTKQEMIQEAKEELNNTVWQIELKAMATSNKKENKGETDTLHFENNKVGSDNLASSGFGPSNYTIRLKGADNDIVVWETMQASEDEGVAFWRGQIQNDIMRGVLSWHVDEKDKRDYNFVSKGEKELIVPPEPTEETASEVEVEAVEPAGEKAETAPIAPPVQEKEIKAPSATRPKESKGSKKEETPKKKKGWWER